MSRDVNRFNLHLEKEIGWHICPKSFEPQQQKSAAAVFFGGDNPPIANVAKLLERGIPLLPVASDMSRVSVEIPVLLQPFNCIAYAAGGAQRVATALLECAGLLPRQRRVFVSYRRGEARDAALQLFDVLSARLFDVFLDTHSIPLAEEFQTMLWHRLCDSDVLVMLDTPGYFKSRWTSLEFGRALAKNISVFRIAWPDATPSASVATANQVKLLPEEVDPKTGRLADEAVERICLKLEEVRSESYAVRFVNLVSNLRNHIQTIKGEVIGVGRNKAVHIRLSNGRTVVVYPTVGVPTSTTLHDAAISSPEQPVAVFYDPIGLHPRWLGHLDWLGQHIRSARWIKAYEASWQFADWEA